MSGFWGEFFGTAVLIVLGVGCGAGVNLKGNYAHGQNWTFISLAWGMAVTFGVFVAGQFGSLGHLNPAVTIGFAAFGFFPWHEVVPYLLGQFLGAFVGAAIVIIQYYPHFQVTKTVNEGNTVGIFSTMPAIKNSLFNFLSEVIATFVFIFTLLNLGNFTQGLKPVIVGLLIMVVGQALGGTTGFALNPARDWGPRLAYTILPVPNRSSAHWEYAWVPMLGPLCGGLLASGLQYVLK
ncbi:MAG: MIP/aquaporin family protein [Liquorilactobacillus nagelii]|uniref:Aquaporin n=1 Tax=Liquorilactobacillus nagelii TaxID=82688 RepID=A0A3Q8CPY2_9LACO|nr:MIP/aquaporin family protein [Liquorilactobacillus nagelii]AUJ32969.1 aquaporin [Liquorilactobacillus nagelii]KRL41629.1 glycerol uptake facilitator protein [Liquorilactobacillus nagelii DSM 13675]MCC7616574.1 aquaporin family protein [Liquorilactobacillus nagelii]MCP9315208.1 aquaporin family protein [Liquorilactobacillus nagelii]QYH55122.1 aquaporin family protein [Liquorilactobacillus nagelii DSM 13675]